MASLLGYRCGWAGRRRLETATSDTEGDESTIWLGDGPCHVAPENNALALCGAVCVHFEEIPFLGRTDQCRDCVLALRVRTRTRSE